MNVVGALRNRIKEIAPGMAELVEKRPLRRPITQACHGFRIFDASYRFGVQAVGFDRRARRHFGQLDQASVGFQHP